MTTNTNSHATAIDRSARTMADKALCCNRRWQLLLAGLAGLCWLLLAASVVGIALFIVTFISPIQIDLARQAAKGVAVEPADMQRLAKTMFLSTRVLYTGSILMAVLLTLAGGATLLYVRASHRVNLRRIRTELADISAQLRLLQQKVTTD